MPVGAPNPEIHLLKFRAEDEKRRTSQLTLYPDTSFSVRTAFPPSSAQTWTASLSEDVYEVPSTITEDPDTPRTEHLLKSCITLNHNASISF